MIKRQNPKVILTIITISIVSILFVLHKNYDSISLYNNLLDKNNLEIDEDSKHYLNYENDSDNVILKDDNCENDYNQSSGEGWTGRINRRTNYLKQRSYCILKFCGEVCDTKHDFETGEVFYMSMDLKA